MASNLTEKIFCIKEDTLFKDGKWNGLKTEGVEKYIELIKTEGEFLVRKELEGNPKYKQVIGQVILKYKDKYFLHRQEKRNENRLNGSCPLALGGHIEEIDLNADKDFLTAILERELKEEVEINAKILDSKILGLIYIEDENPVNWDHIGLVSVFELDGDDVHVIEEGLKNIGFVSLDYLKTNVETLNYWSRIIIYHL